MEGSLNANIDGLATLVIRMAAILFLVSAFAIIAVSVAAGLSGLFGFGGGSDGIGQKGRRGLKIWHGLGNDILRNGVRDDGRRDGRNLHQPNPKAARRKTRLRLSAKSISEMAYIIAYTE